MNVKAKKRDLVKIAAGLGYRLQPPESMQRGGSWRLQKLGGSLGYQQSECLTTQDAVAARLEDLEIVRRANSRVEQLKRELSEALARVDEIKALLESYAPLVQLESSVRARCIRREEKDRLDARGRVVL